MARKLSRRTTIIGSILIVVLAALGFVAWQVLMNPKNDTSVQDVSSFESCKNEPDSLMLETYPEQCKTATGKTFTNPNQKAIPAPAENDTDDDSGALYLTLDDWGVRFKLPSGAEAIRYYKVKDGQGDSYYEFVTARVEALGENCVEPGLDGFVTRLAALSRSTEPSDAIGSPPALAAQIDGYYYYVSGAQSYCAQGSTDIQTVDRKAVTDMLMSVEKK